MSESNETDYLLSSPVNADRLEKSLAEAEAGNDFQKELAALLNKHSMDIETNTPDFILARHIIRDLDTYRETTSELQKWHGSNMRSAANDSLSTPKSMGSTATENGQH